MKQVIAASPDILQHALRIGELVGGSIAFLNIEPIIPLLLVAKQVHDENVEWEKSERSTIKEHAKDCFWCSWPEEWKEQVTEWEAQREVDDQA